MTALLIAAYVGGAALAQRFSFLIIVPPIFATLIIAALTFVGSEDNGINCLFVALCIQLGYLSGGLIEEPAEESEVEAM